MKKCHSGRFEVCVNKREKNGASRVIGSSQSKEPPVTREDSIKEAVSQRTDLIRIGCCRQRMDAFEEVERCYFGVTNKTDMEGRQTQKYDS